MPALPALLLSIHFVFLLLTMTPSSHSQASVLSSVRMGEFPSYNYYTAVPSASFASRTC